MEASLQGLFSVDLPKGPSQMPENPFDCWIPVEAEIGVRGEAGADTFTFYVCTPNRLARSVQRTPYQFGRHLLIVEKFDWSVVESAIQSLLETLTADSWGDLAIRIGRYGHWEYEDYVEYEGTV